MLIVSQSQYYDMMLLEQPDSPEAPIWRARRRRLTLEWMKMAMRSRKWPWSAGPKGKLP